MKLRFHFIVFPLSLTLNNAFALLGGGYYVGTLKWKTLRTRWRFYERKCPVFQETILRNWFS
jgi:hypothetical protein